mgnify:CR=1 FL=1
MGDRGDQVPSPARRPDRGGDRRGPDGNDTSGYGSPDAPNGGSSNSHPSIRPLGLTAAEQAEVLDAIAAALTAGQLSLGEGQAAASDVVVVNEVGAAKAGFGLDVDSGEMVDLVKSGIIDPAMVTRSALQNAASIAKNILTTEAVVVDEQEHEALAAHAVCEVQQAPKRFGWFGLPGRAVAIAKPMWWLGLAWDATHATTNAQPCRACTAPSTGSAP